MNNIPFTYVFNHKFFLRDNNANYNGGDWNCDSTSSAKCLKNVQNLDILSVHFYGGNFAPLMAGSESYAFNAGKAFMVDEFGKLQLLV